MANFFRGLSLDCDGLKLEQKQINTKKKQKFNIFSVSIRFSPTELSGLPILIFSHIFRTILAKNTWIFFALDLSISNNMAYLLKDLYLFILYFFIINKLPKLHRVFLKVFIFNFMKYFKQILNEEN
jgi:hypothetical protein